MVVASDSADIPKVNTRVEKTVQPQVVLDNTLIFIVVSLIVFHNETGTACLKIVH